MGEMVKDIDFSYSASQSSETMVHKTDMFIFQNITLAMLVVCLLGVLVAVLYGWAMMPRSSSMARERLYGVGHYFIPSWRNILYHLFAALLVLAFIQEIAWALVKYWVEMPLELRDGGDMFFSATSGVIGGYIVAKLLKFAHQKLLVSAP
ncbi:hypothetical protein FGF1_13030 [Flavobacteriaceae bacterium GF1]